MVIQVWSSTQSPMPELTVRPRALDAGVGQKDRPVGTTGLLRQWLYSGV